MPEEPGPYATGLARNCSATRIDPTLKKNVEHCRKLSLLLIWALSAFFFFDEHVCRLSMTFKFEWERFRMIMYDSV